MTTGVDPYRSPDTVEVPKASQEKATPLSARLVLLAGVLSAILGNLAFQVSMLGSDFYLSGWYGEQNQDNMMRAKAHSIYLMLVGFALCLLAIVLCSAMIKRRRTALAIIGLVGGSLPFLQLVLGILSNVL